MSVLASLDSLEARARTMFAGAPDSTVAEALAAIPFRAESEAETSVAIAIARVYRDRIRPTMATLTCHEIAAAVREQAPGGIFPDRAASAREDVLNAVLEARHPETVWELLALEPTPADLVTAELAAYLAAIPCDRHGGPA